MLEQEDRHETYLYRMFLNNCHFYSCGINWFVIPGALPSLCLTYSKDVFPPFCTFHCVCLAFCPQPSAPVFCRAPSLKYLGLSLSLDPLQIESPHSVLFREETALVSAPTHTPPPVHLFTLSPIHPSLSFSGCIKKS